VLTASYRPMSAVLFAVTDVWRAAGTAVNGTAAMRRWLCEPLREALYYRVFAASMASANDCVSVLTARFRVHTARVRKCETPCHKCVSRA
jgi:hypothetical protein